MSELIKEIKNGRILKNNGSWMYCNQCNKTVGYLCYTTYRDLQFQFKCKCGSNGSFHLSYSSDRKANKADVELKTIKNRLCCTNDESPLFTIVEKNMVSAQYCVVCKKCNTKYDGGTVINGQES